MKRLNLTALGGMPFEQDDLKWMQDAQKEELVQFLSAFLLPGQTKMALTGFVATANGADVDISAGVLLVDGELVSYTAATIPSGSLLTPTVTVNTQTDPSGDETYLNGDSVSTYEETYAGVNLAPPSLSQGQFIDAINSIQRLEDFWQENSVIEDWNNLTVSAPAATPAAAFSPSSDTPLQYRKMEGNRVELSGSFSHTAVASGSIAQLPVGYRPDKRIYLPMLRTAHTSSADYDFSLRIDPDGNMYIGNLTTLTATDQFCVDGLSFPLERGT